MSFYAIATSAKESLEEIYEGYRQEARQKGMGYRFLWIKLDGAQEKHFHLHRRKYSWGVRIKVVRQRPDDCLDIAMEISKDGSALSSEIIRGAPSNLVVLAQLAQNRIISVRSFGNKKEHCKIISMDTHFAQEIYHLGISPDLWCATTEGLYIFDNYNNIVRFLDKKHLQYSYPTIYEDCEGVGSKDGIINDCQRNVMHLLSWQPTQLKAVRLPGGYTGKGVFVGNFSCVNILMVRSDHLILLDTRGVIRKLSWDDTRHGYSAPNSIGRVDLPSARYQRVASARGIYLHTFTTPIKVIKVEFFPLSLGAWCHLDAPGRARLETIVLTLRKCSPAMPKPIINEILLRI